MISTCPVCSYCLAGLPEQHSCPECGFEYNRNTIVVKQARLGRKIVAVIFGVGLVAMLMMWWLRHTNAMPVVVFAGSLVGSVIRLLSAKRAAVVSEEAVTVLQGGAIKERFSLAGVRNAEWSRVSGAVIATRCDGTRAFRIPKKCLWSDRMGRRLASAINHYCQSQEGE